MIFGVASRSGAPVTSAFSALSAHPSKPTLRHHADDADGIALGAMPGPGRHSGCVNLDRLVVAADVRLDDRAGLRAALGISGTQDIDDLGLIAHAYQSWGEGCPARLLGDFAFAIWDRDRKALFCARDPVGARPFYFGVAREHFFLASSIDAMMGAPGLSDEVDEGFLAAHLGHDLYVTSGRTFFRDIQRLPPGHSMTVTAAGRTVKQYWSIDGAPDVRFRSDADYVAALRELHSKSRQRQTAGSRRGWRPCQRWPGLLRRRGYGCPAPSCRWS